MASCGGRGHKHPWTAVASSDIDVAGSQAGNEGGRALENKQQAGQDRNEMEGMGPVGALVEPRVWWRFDLNS